jgi:hypothetical protein
MYSIVKMGVKKIISGPPFLMPKINIYCEWFLHKTLGCETPDPVNILEAVMLNILPA